MNSRFAETLEALATVSVRRTGELILARSIDALFDARYGLDTTARIPMDVLDLPASTKGHATPYQPTSLPAFRALLRAVDLPRDCRFVDYGCGKGRVLLMAAEVGFLRVVGIEAAPGLCDICRANIGRFRGARPHLPSIEVIEADASQYVPTPDIGIFYFYCPFDETLMHAPTGRILESLRRSPRSAWLVYNLPRRRRAVESYPELVVERAVLVGGHACIVYRYRPC